MLGEPEQVKLPHSLISYVMESEYYSMSLYCSITVLVVGSTVCLLYLAVFTVLGVGSNKSTVQLAVSLSVSTVRTTKTVQYSR